MVRELRIETPEPEISWEAKCEFLYDFAVDGVPVPDNFRDLLTDEYGHLAMVPSPRVPEVERAWGNYLAWAGDITEDPRTPLERLTAYYAEQEQVKL